MLMKSYNSISCIFKADSLITMIALAIFSAIASICLSYKFLQALQQKGYVCSDYFKWANKKNNVFNSRLIMLSLLSVFAFFLYNAVFAFAEKDFFTLTGLAFFVLFSLFYIVGERKMENKVPLKITNRIKRLLVTYFIISTILFFGLILAFNLLCYAVPFNFLKIMRFSVVTLLPLLMPNLIFVASLINKPIEKSICKKFVRVAIERLDRPNLIKIGITGSYGKTSVKNFLAKILEEKYEVVSTPSSYNTPMGIAKSTELLKDTTEVFIAEMGARKVGDIKELCDIVKPQYGILNGIIGAHLLTFGTIEKVVKTKNELMEAIPNGVGVFTCDNQNALGLAEQYKGEKILAGLNRENSPEVYAEDIKVDKFGSEFTLNLFGQSIKCKTELLGRHNISNITLAAALAYKLGLSVEQIKEGISKIEPVEHRLNIIDNGKVTIIDDAYNSNAEGVKSALEVLNFFEGRKIIVTPGMTELGANQTKENYEFGVQLASAVDYAFLVEGGSANAIRNGMVFGAGFDHKKVKVVANLTVAKDKLGKMIEEGDIILFENDLTDN